MLASVPGEQPVETELLPLRVPPHRRTASGSPERPIAESAFHLLFNTHELANLYVGAIDTLRANRSAKRPGEWWRPASASVLPDRANKGLFFEKLNSARDCVHSTRL